MSLPTDYKARKSTPIATGVIDYFPDALAEVSQASLAGNKQHLDGQPLRWDKSKSADEADALIRHFIERGTRDGDGVRHSAKVAWRALALLQREIDAEARIEAATAKALDDAKTDALVFGVGAVRIEPGRLFELAYNGPLMKRMDKIINPPVVERQVWVDKGDGKIVQETRVEPMFGRSPAADVLVDIRKLNTLTKRVVKRRPARKGRKS